MSAMTLSSGAGRVVDAAEHEFQRVKAALHEQLVESFDLAVVAEGGVL